MSVKDCLLHTMEAYCEVIAEPRFEIRGDLDGLILAPIKGTFAIHFLPRGTELYSAEGWLNAQIAFMLGQLSVARADWCADRLDPLDVETV